jgi:hypothetical protein
LVVVIFAVRTADVVVVGGTVVTVVGGSGATAVVGGGVVVKEVVVGEPGIVHIVDGGDTTVSSGATETAGSSSVVGVWAPTDRFKVGLRRSALPTKSATAPAPISIEATAKKRRRGTQRL